MTTYRYAPPVIDFSRFPEDDGEPMAETTLNRIQMTNLIFGFERMLAPRGRVNVGGNLLMYYNPESGWDHVSPDVYVAFDVEPGMRRKWLTWEEGKFPEVVFEISSESTVAADLGEKRDLYARLGVHEYYLFDPQGEMQPRFQCFFRVDDRLMPVPIAADERVYSPLMGLELRVVDDWLRVIDPATGEPVPNPDDTWRLWHEEEQARLAAEERASEAEERAAEEARARLAAELRLQAVLAELERLQRQDGGAPPA